MFTVRDFATTACKPKSISVLIGGESYELVSEYTEAVDRRLLELLGDFVVENFKANTPDEYSVWLMERPVKIEDL
jgi:hypothetical protein